MAALGYVLLMALAAVKVGGATMDHDLCLGCICRTVSGCDIHRGCLGDGCGPFHISRDQWMAAGSPVQHRDDPHERQAFERCVLEPFCAAEAVLVYTNKYAKDCDGDGKVTCMDLFMVHVFGRNCSSHLLGDKDKINMMACLKEDENDGNRALEENKTAPVTSPPTQPTLKSVYASTPRTNPSTATPINIYPTKQTTNQVYPRSTLMTATPINIYPTKQTTSQIYPNTDVSTAKPQYIPTRFVFPTRMTSKPVYTTPHYRATMKTTPRPIMPRPTSGTRRSSMSVRTSISNNTFVERPVLDS